MYETYDEFVPSKQYIVSLYLNDIMEREFITSYEGISAVMDEYKEILLVNILNKGDTGYICVDTYQQ